MVYFENEHHPLHITSVQYITNLTRRGYDGPLTWGRNRHRFGNLCGYVVVQFYSWFNFYFPLSYSHYHTLPYTKTKEIKNWTKEKFEPQKIFINCSREAVHCNIQLTHNSFLSHTVKLSSRKRSPRSLPRIGSCKQPCNKTIIEGGRLQ